MKGLTDTFDRVVAVITIISFTGMLIIIVATCSGTAKVMSTVVFVTVKCEAQP